MGTSKRAEKKANRQRNNQQKQLNVASPATAKALPEASAASSIDHAQFEWNSSALDHEYAGDWDWNLTPSEIHGLLETLTELSRLTWREVRALTYNGKGRARRVLHKSQGTDSVCQDAQDRLAEIQISTEELFRLRRGTHLRIWGYLTGSVFHIVWYDRDHKVCPLDND